MHVITVGRGVWEGIADMMGSVDSADIIRSIDLSSGSKGCPSTLGGADSTEVKDDLQEYTDSDAMELVSESEPDRSSIPAQGSNAFEQAADSLSKAVAGIKGLVLGL